MNFNNIDDIKRYIADHKERDEDLAHETRMIMFRMLSEIERIMELRNVNKKELAQEIGTSPSYITQLFRGSKTINISTIAKIQDALDFKFKFDAISKEHFERASVGDYWNLNFKPAIDKSSFWLVVNQNVECNDFDSISVKETREFPELKVA